MSTIWVGSPICSPWLAGKCLKKLAYMGGSSKNALFGRLKGEKTTSRRPFWVSPVRRPNRSPFQKLLPSHALQGARQAARRSAALRPRERIPGSKGRDRPRTAQHPTAAGLWIAPFGFHLSKALVTGKSTGDGAYKAFLATGNLQMAPKHPNL